MSTPTARILDLRPAPLDGPLFFDVVVDVRCPFCSAVHWHGAAAAQVARGVAVAAGCGGPGRYVLGGDRALEDYRARRFPWIPPAWAAA